MTETKKAWSKRELIVLVIFVALASGPATVAAEEKTYPWRFASYSATFPCEPEDVSIDPYWGFTCQTEDGVGFHAIVKKGKGPGFAPPREYVALVNGGGENLSVDGVVDSGPPGFVVEITITGENPAKEIARVIRTKNGYMELILRYPTPAPQLSRERLNRYRALFIDGAKTSAPYTGSALPSNKGATGS